MPKLVFFGTETYSLVALRQLVEKGFNVAVVVTKPDTVKGRGRSASIPPVKQYAMQHNIPVWQPDRLQDIKEQLLHVDAVAGVLVAYGKIIPQSIIELFRCGIINLHPSLLPSYRGPSPIEAAMRNQDTQTGISIMALNAKMDAGPVYYQEAYPLTGRENRIELYDALFAKGSQLLVDTLPSIIRGELGSYPQNEAHASYCALLAKSDAWIDLKAITAAEAEAHVRAYLGFPGTRVLLDDQEVIITQATTKDAPTALSLQCKDNRYLAINRLKPVGRNEMSASDFLSGYRK